MFCVDETKLDNSFPNSQFILENFQFRRDRNSKGGRKLVYEKQGIIAKRLENLETIYIELTISIKKWCALFAYRSQTQNKTSFFEEISSSLSHIVNKYENYTIAGDLNIKMLDPKGGGNSHFSDLKYTYIISQI